MTMLQYIFIAFAFAFNGAGYYTYRIIELIKFMRTQEAINGRMPYTMHDNITDDFSSGLLLLFAVLFFVLLFAKRKAH